MLQFLLHDDVTGYLLARIAVRITVYVPNWINTVLANLRQTAIAINV
jgi:hypothetical protein